MLSMLALMSHTHIHTHSQTYTCIYMLTHPQCARTHTPPTHTHIPTHTHTYQGRSQNNIFGRPRKIWIFLIYFAMCTRCIIFRRYFSFWVSFRTNWVGLWLPRPTRGYATDTYTYTHPHTYRDTHNQAGRRDTQK